MGNLSPDISLVPESTIQLERVLLFKLVGTAIDILAFCTLSLSSHFDDDQIEKLLKIIRRLLPRMKKLLAY